MTTTGVSDLFPDESSNQGSSYDSSQLTDEYGNPVSWNPNLSTQTTYTNGQNAGTSVTDSSTGLSSTPTDGSGTSLSSALNNISKFISTNKGILGLGALGSLATSNTGGGGAGSSSASIPALIASRMQVPGASSVVTPGQPNQQYFTDTLYTDPSQQANAQAAIEAQAQAIAANRTNAPVPNFAMPYNNMPQAQPAPYNGPNLYTNYTPSDIANYISQNNINVNDPAAVAAATKATNANPAVVSQYIASLNKTPATGVASLPTSTPIVPQTGGGLKPATPVSTAATTLPTTSAGILTALQNGTITPTQAKTAMATVASSGVPSGITSLSPTPTPAPTPAPTPTPTPTPAASQGYTPYTAQQIKDYLAQNPGVNVALAEQQTNADPNFVNQVIQSMAPAANNPLAQIIQNEQASQPAYVAPTPTPAPNPTPAPSLPATTDTITQIVSQGQAAGQTPTQMAASLIAQGIPASDVIAVVGPQNADVVNQAYAAASADNSASFGYDTAADGGLMELHYAMGGSTPAEPRYLQGHTDGMADELNTSIDGVQPAKLSHGEFVVPADVVSHLGNGNSDAGAKKLYEMMARVRKARTGNEKQGKKIDPDKFMYGGKAYAKGGIASFDGTTGSTVSNTSGIPGLTNTGGTSTQGLSSYIAPYVTNMLGQGQALANTSMPVYQGPLTAGQSALQNQQFMGLSEMAQTGYNPMQYQTQNWSNQGAPQMPDLSVPSQTQSVSQAANQGTAGYGQPMSLNMDQGSSAASQYMNPYLSQSLQPQLNLLAQTAQTNEQADLGKLTSQGAFGGSRQAVLQGMDQNALLGQQANLIGQGYNTAYNNAQTQFNADQQRQLQAQQNTEASRQFSAGFGQQNLAALGQAGGVQQGIQNAADQAAYAEFQKQQQYPYQQLAFDQSLLQGLPTGTTTTTPNAMSDLGTALAALGVTQNPLVSNFLGLGSSTTPSTTTNPQG